MLVARAILVALIAIFVIGSARAESRHRLHTQQKIQSPSANPAQPSEPDQRGTDQVPLTVKILPSESAKEKTGKEEQERAEKARVDKKLADETQRLANETHALRLYTGGLALFTLFLFCASVVQIGLFVWQLRLIKQSLDDAKIAAEAATVGAKAAKQSADSLRNIERAYVFIDYELLRESNEPLWIGGIFNKQIALVFKNFGRTPAIVNGVNRKCLRWPNRYLPEMEPDSIKTPIGIAIGSSSPWSIPTFFDGTERDINDANMGDGSIYLYGKITYLDMLGEQRETGFCCEWNFAEAQFFMAPDTTLNYYT